MNARDDYPKLAFYAKHYEGIDLATRIGQALDEIDRLRALIPGDVEADEFDWANAAIITPDGPE